MRAAPRVPPVEPGTRPELASLERTIVARRGRVSTLYRVLLHSPPVAAGWEAMLTAVRQQTTVPAALRELAILRIAVLNRAAFEFDAHAPIARDAGVPQAKVDATRASTIGEPFDDDERLVLALADRMTRDVDVDDATMDALLARFGPATLVELVATVAAYNMVSRFLVAMRIGH